MLAARQAASAVADLQRWGDVQGQGGEPAGRRSGAIERLSVLDRVPLVAAARIRLERLGE
jgi:hypothetical protein